MEMSSRARVLCFGVGPLGLLWLVPILACAGPSTGPPDDLLSLAATMQQSNGRISVQVSARNAGSTEFVGEYRGVCAVAVLLWKSDEDRLRWDQFDWFNTRPGGCKWLVTPLRIPPDSEVEVSTRVVSPADVLGDSLPAGDYDVAVRLRLVTPFDSTFIVAAGRATLSR